MNLVRLLVCAYHFHLSNKAEIVKESGATRSIAEILISASVSWRVFGSHRLPGMEIDWHRHIVIIYENPKIFFKLPAIPVRLPLNNSRQWS